MSRNDARDFAERLYSRIPGHYRVYDAERGQPLFALLLVVGQQVAALRQDLDALWDNFFIETCDDWVVPYIGALVGANLLQQPVGQSNRLDVWNTVVWRRSRGTPQMLQELAAAISGWPVDFAEFFQSLGWSQNVNHPRLDHPLMPDLRHQAQLQLLGHAADPFAHAADFRPSQPMEQGRVTPQSESLSVAGFGTPGRYQIKNLGFFVRRLRPLPVRGATPAADVPGAKPVANASLFAFHPLFRDTPLFAADSGVPVEPAAFAANPWKFFGDQSSIAVRQFGLLLAAGAAPQASLSSSQSPFTFGGATSVSLDASSGMRVLNPGAFQLGSVQFTIAAQWLRTATPTITVGTLNTLAAALNKPAFTVGAAGSGAGQLAITIRTVGASPSGRFPATVLAIRAARTGALHTSDALYVYLPSTFVKANAPVQYLVAADGSTYAGSALPTAKLARSSEGQIYPACIPTTSTDPANIFTTLSRRPGGMVLPDSARFGGVGVLVEADLFTGPSTFQSLGTIATVDQTGTGGTVTAFTYTPSTAAIKGTNPSQGILSILLRPLAGDFLPACELVLANRAGRSLLVYLPEQSGVTAAGIRVLVADDGSTWFAPTDALKQQTVLGQQSFDGLILARAATGQSLPIPAVWPIQQRIPVAANLCRSERTSLLKPGELGIDPRLGRFGLPANDPAIARGGFSVDYVEAFGDTIGANSERQVAAPTAATRLVSLSGDADSALTLALDSAPIHTSLSAAIGAANTGDVIEIVDSGTYPATAGIALGNAAIKRLTIRAAAGQRPCLTFYGAANAPAAASLLVTTPMDALALDGLLISGGAIFIQAKVGEFDLNSCTLDPRSTQFASIVGVSSDSGSDVRWQLSRCISGGVRTGPGIATLTISDSILDQKNGSAIAGLAGLTSPPPVLKLQSDQAAKLVQLERVTVFGSILCEVLQASECLFDSIVTALDQQSGCVRFTRFEPGSALPRRYQCIPGESQLGACPKNLRCLAPVFNSRIFGLPGYAQLGLNCPGEILRASENGAEVGAFAGAQNTIRLRNLMTKLQEFMPVGLSAVVVAET
jgi:hypothetical protein